MGWRKRQDMQEEERKEKDELSKNQVIPKTYINSIGMKFSLIPHGEFMMGSEDMTKNVTWKIFDFGEYYLEKPVHRVKIEQSFYLGTYPVTQKEWKSRNGK